MIARISRVPRYTVRNIERYHALHFGCYLIAIHCAIKNLKRLAIGVDVLPIVGIADEKLFG